MAYDLKPVPPSRRACSGYIGVTRCGSMPIYFRITRYSYCKSRDIQSVRRLILWNNVMTTLRQRKNAMTTTVNTCFLVTDTGADKEVLAFKQREVIETTADSIEAGYTAYKAGKTDKGANEKLIQALVLADIPSSNFRQRDLVEGEEQTEYDQGKIMLQMALPTDVQNLLAMNDQACTSEQIKERVDVSKWIGKRMSSIERSLVRRYAKIQKAVNKAAGIKEPAKVDDSKTEKTPAIKLNEALLASEKAIQEYEAPTFDTIEALKKLNELRSFIAK